MILCIQSILTPAVLAEFRAALPRLSWVDGAGTAGWHAKLVKKNLQAAKDDALAETLRQRVLEGLHASELFKLAAWPRTAGSPLISRYDTGMEYGLHIDDALMGPLRSDISYTIFLSDPASYDGGELALISPVGEQRFKLPEGGMVLYPSTALHKVLPIGRGVRHAAVGWVQSLVRDPARREILFDLETARRGLFQKQGKNAEFDLLSKSAANLMRMWTET
jgi:PKHD-type hydroxylase